MVRASTPPGDPMPRIAEIEVEGFSIAGIETAIELPEFGVVLDLGRCADRTFRHARVLLSHGHVDHCAGVLQHSARRELNGLPAASYVARSGDVGALTALFAAGRELAGGGLPATVTPLDPGGVLELRRDLVARAFETVHRIGSQGYVLSRRRRRLREEFAALTRDEVAERARAGEVLTETVTDPLVAFSGDTRIEGVLADREVLRAKLLILEATYLDRKHGVETARERGHVHLEEIVAHAGAFENDAILLHHFSARYDAAFVRSRVRRAMPRSLRDRVHVLL
jgi:ribonuclease Z